MSLPLVARTAALDPLRSGSGYVKVAVFVILYGMVGYVAGSSASDLAQGVVMVSTGLIPLFAFPLAYDAVAGPRQSGTARLLLAYPHSRRDVVLGTAAGRAAEFGSYVAVGLLVGLVVNVVAGGRVAPVSFAVAAVASVAYAAVFALLVVGCSAAVATTNRAVALVLGLLFTVGLVWRQIPLAVVTGLRRVGVDPHPDAWVPVFNALSPIDAFSTLVRTLDPAAAVQASGFHATGWFAALVLLAWATLPVAGGYARFRDADL